MTTSSERMLTHGFEHESDARPIVVIYRAVESCEDQELLPGDSQGKRAHRNEFRRDLCELLIARLYERKLEGSIYECGSTTNRTHYDELIGEVAIALIDVEALRSPDFARVASFLAWRSRLGLPLVVPLLGSVKPEDVAASKLGVLGASTILRPTDNKTNRQAREQYAEAIAQQVIELHQSRLVPPALDPATMWARDVSEALANLPRHQLEGLAAHLELNPSDAAQRQRRETALAAALFGASLDSAIKFLRQAADSLDRSSATRVLVERALPLWVDLDAGRLVMSAAEMPTRSRVCGIGLNRLDLAEHAVKRGSANARGFPATPLPGNGGEHIVQELAIRHEETLRQSLNLQPDDPPEFISAQLRGVHRAVFALLDCTPLSPESTRNLVLNLMGKFPGITFVLVAETVDDFDGTFPSLATAQVVSDEMMARRVRFYVANISALIGEEVLN